jgi:hypothetical protein
MEFDTWNSKVLGLVFDLSLRHAEDGKRIVDHVKKAFVEYLRESFDDDDILYLFHPDIWDPVDTRGEQIAAIANFDTDGWKYDLGYALRQTLYILGNEDDDFRKILVLVTDQLDSDTALRQVATLNKNEMIDCELVVLGIGDRYNHDLVIDPWTHILSSPVNLSSALKESLIYGSQ